MKTLFDYTDYRSFLADYYRARKLTHKEFSHRSFLQKAGISGPSFLREVIDGKKNLSADGSRKFARALELDNKESAYFRNLVLFNQAKKPTVKQRWFQKLSSDSPDTCVYSLTRDKFDYFGHWYNVAVREYIHSRPFSGDYNTMVAAIMPRITVGQAKSAVALLTKLSLITKGNDGLFQVTDPRISFDAEIENLAAHKLHKSMQKITMTAMDSVPKHERYVRTLIGSFSEEAFQKIRLELDSARKNILSIISNDPGVKKVYHLGMQLYPLEKPGKNGKGAG